MKVYRLYSRTFTIESERCEVHSVNVTRNGQPPISNSTNEYIQFWNVLLSGQVQDFNDSESARRQGVNQNGIDLLRLPR